MPTPHYGPTPEMRAQQESLVEARDQTEVAQGTASPAAQMDGSAGNLLAAAGGGFKLDPQIAATLAAACQTAIDHIRDMANDLEFIRQAPKLGTLTGAQEIASYTQNMATDPQGMVEAIQSLSATLQQMRDAYVQASTNYQETNDQVADILKKIDPGNTPPATPPPTGSATHFNP